MTITGKNPPLRYDQGCLAAHALNLIGDRWALLVVRELMFSAKRFQQIRAGLPDMTASVLTTRLTQLHQAGVVTTGPDYALTDAGRALMPVLQSLCRWALLVPGHDPSRFISPSALMISMTCNVDSAALPDAVAGFQIGAERFIQRPRPLRITASDEHTDFTLTGTGNALAMVVYGKRPPADHGVTVQGDAALARRWIAAFGLGR